MNLSLRLFSETKEKKLFEICELKMNETLTGSYRFLLRSLIQVIILGRYMKQTNLVRNIILDS